LSQEVERKNQLIDTLTTEVGQLRQQVANQKPAVNNKVTEKLERELQKCKTEVASLKEKVCVPV